MTALRTPGVARRASRWVSVQRGPDARKRTGFRPDVEGLRAVAILLVVLYHTGLGATGGYVGVDVFFVISGFLITGQLLRELNTTGRISFLGFYARRARRILPAATLTTIATVIAAALLLSPLAARRVFADARAAVFFVANFHFAAQGSNYLNASLPPSPVQHYWSLSVEEQFYFAWPLLLMLSSLAWVAHRQRLAKRAGRPGRPGAAARAGRPRPGVVALALAAIVTASLLVSIGQTRTSPIWAYYSILTRAWELAAGALVALSIPLLGRLDRRLAVPLTWLGLAAITVAAFSFSNATPYPGDAALLPVAGAVAVIAGGTVTGTRWGSEALLGTPPFQRLGSWSYSWYLWHWPALILAPALLGHPLSKPEALAVLAISLIIAVLSFVLVERPIRRIQVIVRRPALGLAGGGALAATAIAVGAVAGPMLASLPSAAAASAPALTAAHQLTPRQLSIDLARGVNTSRVPSNLDPPLVKASRSLPVIVTNGCHLQHDGDRSKPCVYGDTRSGTSVVLFGDSHAAAWFPALEIISRRQHWRLVDFTKAGCPAVEVNIVFPRGHTPYTQCTTWRRNAMAQIAALHPAMVIIAFARYLEEPEARALAGVPGGHGSAWLDGLAAMFQFLGRSSSHVVFLSDVPTLARLDPDCVSGHPTDVRACTTARSAAIRLPAVRNQEVRLARQDHVATIDPTSWFCDPTRCPAIVGNILLYRDNAHMVPAWSQFIAPVLEDALTPVMHTANRPASR